MDISRLLNAADVISPQDTTGLSQFHLFSKLPFELRIAIWELMTLGPRHVLLLDPEYPDVHACSDPLPVIFEVNQESRTLALKHYMDLSPPQYTSLQRNDPQQYRYLHPNHDFAVIRLSDIHGIDKIHENFGKTRQGREVIARITKLMVTGNHLKFASLPGAEPAWAEILKQSMQTFFKYFDGLEEVFLELRRCNAPDSAAIRREPSGQDTSAETARLMEHHFPIYLSVLPKKYKLEVVVVDWQDGLIDETF